MRAENFIPLCERWLRRARLETGTDSVECAMLKTNLLSALGRNVLLSISCLALAGVIFLTGCAMTPETTTTTTTTRKVDRTQSSMYAR